MFGTKKKETKIYSVDMTFRGENGRIWKVSVLNVVKFKITPACGDGYLHELHCADGTEIAYREDHAVQKLMEYKAVVSRVITE